MFGIGFPELLMILVVALLVIGPKKLPDLARSLGKGLAEFRKATDDLKETIYPQEPASEVNAEQTAQQRQVVKLPPTPDVDESVKTEENPDVQKTEKDPE